MRERPEKVFGDYYLISEIGRGSTGIVYSARCGNTVVALKVFASGTDKQSSVRRSFENELEAIKSLDHDYAFSSRSSL